MKRRDRKGRLIVAGVRRNPAPQEWEYVLPSYWASYLVNGDASGLRKGEVREIDAWIASKPELETASVNVDSEEYFSHRNDANNVGGEVSHYTFFKMTPGQAGEYYGDMHKSGKNAAVLKGALRVEVWEERDNLQITLYKGDTEIASWSDDEAREMFEDGFFERRNVTNSVIAYAKSVGLV